MTSRKTRLNVSWTLAVISIVGMTRPTETAAACRAPSALEVVVYEDANLKGACQILGVGAYPNTSSFGGRNDKISSLSVGSSVRVAFYKDGNYSGPEADFEGGYWYNVGNEVNDQTSSVIVQANNGHAAAIWYEGNWPNDRENFWASDVQGIAHDSWGWYLTHNSVLDANVWAKNDPYYPGDFCIHTYPFFFCKKIPEVFGVPFGIDLATDDYAGCCKRALLPRDLVRQGYNHFGDLDHLDGYLFIPVEGDGLPPLLAIYRASDLSFVTWDIFDNASPDGGGTRHAAWLMIDPNLEILYTSNEDISNSRGGIQAYRIDMNNLRSMDMAFRSGGGYACIRGHSCKILQYLPDKIQQLYDRDGKTPIDLKYLQGGVLSADGNLIYLSNGCCEDLRNKSEYWGVHVFDRHSGILQATSGNDYGPFNYQFDAGFPNYQEPEGLDYLDTTGLGIPHVPNSQLHVLLYSNRSDAMWLKHYSE
jgi:hypothetical protein